MCKTTVHFTADLQRRLREHAPRPTITSLGAGVDGDREATDARAWVRARWAEEHA